MRHLLLILFFFTANSLFAKQDISKTIKEHCAKNNLEAICMSPYEEGSIDGPTNVSFMDTITLDNKEYLFVVSSIENGNLHGHSLGCVNYFFLEKVGSFWSVVTEILNSDPLPLMDGIDYSLVQIGKNRMALSYTSESTGNHHYQKNTSLTHIQFGQLNNVLYLDLEYNNTGWILADAPDSPCEAQKTTQTFEIIASDKEWFDIEVTENKFEFSAGCEEETLAKSEKHTYRFNGTKYEKIK